MSDLERLARAAHKAELALNNETNAAVIEIDWEMHGWRYIEGTKAVLQALAEPSEEMVSVGHAILFGRGINVQPHDFPDAFKAAIQHILDQEPNHE